jgi:hypothetical protein
MNRKEKTVNFLNKGYSKIKMKYNKQIQEKLQPKKPKVS